MKNVMSVCFAIAFLSLGISAQEDQFINEFPENGYANTYEDGTEVVLMILDKESNLPICQFSNQVRINSEFIPENRIGDVDTTSTQDLRICQEEDVWAAVEEEMLVGMVVGTPLNFSPVLPMIVGGAGGCLLGYIIQLAEASSDTGKTRLDLRLLIYGMGGVPIGMVGSLLSFLNSLRSPPPWSLPQMNFFVKGIGVGVLFAVVVGEVCRERE